jgi:hypothetical protein
MEIVAGSQDRDAHHSITISTPPKMPGWRAQVRSGNPLKELVRFSKVVEIEGRVFRERATLIRVTTNNREGERVDGADAGCSPSGSA